METFKAARMRLFEELRAAGYKSSFPRALKTPWVLAQHPDAPEPVDSPPKIYFKTQAVYLDSHSLHVDIRGLSMNDLLWACAMRMSPL